MYHILWTVGWRWGAVQRIRRKNIHNNCIQVQNNSGAVKKQRSKKGSGRMSRISPKHSEGKSPRVWTNVGGLPEGGALWLRKAHLPGYLHCWVRNGLNWCLYQHRRPRSMLSSGGSGWLYGICVYFRNGNRRTVFLEAYVCWALGDCHIWKREGKKKRTGTGILFWDSKE